MKQQRHYDVKTSDFFKDVYKKGVNVKKNPDFLKSAVALGGIGQNKR
jgi:hypothetical protein